MERFRASVSDNSRHTLAPAAGPSFTCAGNINEAIDDYGALPRRQLARVGDLTTRDGPNVVRGDGGHRCEQHDAIVFLDHVDDSLLARVSRQGSWG